MNKADLITVRDFAVGDEAFILSTWLKGLLYGGDQVYRRIPKDIYFSNQHKLIERILTSPQAEIRLAVLKEDPDVILGYSVYRVLESAFVLDWVFVKKEWRGVGIAKSLMPPIVTAVTHLTRIGAGILEKNPKVIFNPYL